jgi:hypothetical protein
MFGAVRRRRAYERQEELRIEREADRILAGDPIALNRDLLHRGSLSDRERLRRVLDRKRRARAG